MTFHESFDPRFDRFVLGNAPPKQIATGFDWVEGPVWFGDAGCLLFSDIPNERILRWTPDDGVTTFRKPSNFANGNTRDRQGRLLTCEHGTRRVTRTELDGAVTVLADRFNGSRLNSPNDIVVKSDGSVWFSDPHYGIKTDYEGYRATQELDCCVYRIDPSGDIRAVVTSLQGPNGLAFSPDEKRLYVADTGRMFTDDPRQIHVFDVAPDGSLTGGDIFHVIAPGCADGIRVDTDGNLWSSAGDGVHCIAPDGKLLGKVHIPEAVSNLCFGGRAKNRLFITASTSVYSIVLNRTGAQWP